ncbi:MFS transporter [Streptomyces sp. NPDC057565]|uniref:MFS transporter n=1 Tax=Streptomyces sp. NPDC057565 TaxID=3346169 RepID=UPI00369130FB
MSLPPDSLSAGSLSPDSPPSDSVPSDSLPTEDAGTGTASLAGGQLPRELRRLFLAAPWASALAPIAYGASTFFFALQVQLMEGEEGKVAGLAVVSTLAAVAAMVAQPVIGVLSDRTRSRFGARRPWMLVGGLIGSVALLTTGLTSSLAALTVCVMVIQFGLNAFQGPLAAVLPDRVPERFRGRYSTGAGLGTILGAAVGPLVGSLFAERITLGYQVLGGVVFLGIVLFVVFVPDRDNRGEPREPFSLRAFVTAFWVNPVRHPDFFWGFLGRMLLFGGYYMLSTYNLYLAQQYIRLSLKEATDIVPLLGLVALPGIILATAIAGPLSDRIGRRKPPALIAGLLIAGGATIPLAMPTVAGLVVSNAIVGAGFGAFVAVDQALMSSVLPNAGDHGKDLGILNLAATLPGTIAPVAAGAVVTAFDSYAALYPVVGVVATLGALCILPIRSVR